MLSEKPWLTRRYGLICSKRGEAFIKVANNPDSRVHALIIGEIAIGNCGGRQYFIDAL